ncbi:MAG: methyltransferase domain-containing protein, partial [Candidatus Binataceae bacterium]
MSQRWDPDRYAANARFVADLGAPLIDLLAPKRGERILDLGCGDGALTEKLAATGAIVVGVDGSGEMVAAARARGLDARVMDGQALEFDHEFDAVLSNAAIHWMRRA